MRKNVQWVKESDPVGDNWLRTHTKISIKYMSHKNVTKIMYYEDVTKDTFISRIRT